VENSLDAKDLIRQMVARYETMSSYSDTGHVTTKIFETNVIHRRSFSMLYQKPSLFRFAFYSPHPYPPLAHIMTEHVAGFDGNEGYLLTKKHGDTLAKKSIRSLSSAIAGATGISSDSAHTIGRLLLAEVEGLSMMDLVNPQLGGETSIDGIACYSILAKLPRGGDREVWIEKDSLLLRKVVNVRDTARAEEIRENIRINEPLEVRLFAA